MDTLNNKYERRIYIMKKVMFIILLNLVLWFGLTSLSNIANAGEYNKAVIAHVL